MSDNATNSSVTGVGPLGKTELWDHSATHPHSNIVFLQDNCPKWLRVEFGDFPEIMENRMYDVLCLLFNNYLLSDRYWFKLAFTPAFHLVRGYEEKKENKDWVYPFYLYFLLV